MKLQRGFGLLNELEARTHVWNASGTFQVPLRFSNDHTWVEFLSPEGNRPPLDEWGLLLGEALHHGRSALDAAAWELANLNGPLGNPRAIDFPITDTEEKWESARARLNPYIADDYLDKLRAMQPWVEQADPGTINWLVALHELDIRDKHRGSITAIPQFQGFEAEGMMLGFADMTGEARVHLEIVPPGLSPTTPPGTVIARFGFGERFSQDSKLPQQGHFAVAAAVVTDSGIILPIAELRDSMMTFLHHALEKIRMGEHVARFGMTPKTP
jgi:hypothetical protein